MPAVFQGFKRRGTVGQSIAWSILLECRSISGFNALDTQGTPSILDVCIAGTACTIRYVLPIVLVLAEFRPSILLILQVRRVFRPPVLYVLSVLGVRKVLDAPRIEYIRSIVYSRSICALFLSFRANTSIRAGKTSHLPALFRAWHLVRSSGQYLLRNTAVCATCRTAQLLIHSPVSTYMLKYAGRTYEYHHARVIAHPGKTHTGRITHTYVMSNTYVERRKEACTSAVYKQS